MNAKKTAFAQRAVGATKVAAFLMAAASTVNSPDSSAQAQGYQPINVSVNGQYINLGDVTPIQQDGRVLVPLRGVLEALGATVGYDARTSTVLAQRGTTQISLPLGSTRAQVNGQTRLLDVPARTINGRTVVPLRFMSEALGANVNWNSGTRVVYISTGATQTNFPNNNYPNGSYPSGSALPTGRVITVTGTVSRDTTGQRRFEVLTDNGVLLDVRARNNQPTGLNAGDVVQLRGEYRNNIFVAETVQIVSNTTQNVNVTGTVVSVYSDNRLTLRLDNGRVVTVVARNGFTSNLTNGDRVRVTGRQNGTTIRNATVRVTRDIVTAPTGRDVDFRATVVSVDRAGRTLQVRGDNGQLYVVRYYGNQSLVEGDRVRVVGTSSNGVTTAESVTQL